MRTEPNLQNMTTRTELGRQILDAFNPKTDLFTCDYAAFEQTGWIDSVGNLRYKAEPNKRKAIRFLVQAATTERERSHYMERLQQFDRSWK